MKKAVILVGLNLSPELAKKECEGAFVVGADKGAFYCLEHGLDMDVAVGDFDSLSQEQYEQVDSKAKKVIRLNPIKDDTDTAHALSLLNGYEEILILGGIGGKRVEHFLANLDLLVNDTRLSLEDDDSYIHCFAPGQYQIEKDGYEFFSFFAMEDALVSLSGFAYPLEKFYLRRHDPLGVSNRILGEKGYLKLWDGKLLLIKSKGD